LMPSQCTWPITVVAFTSIRYLRAKPVFPPVHGYLRPKPFAAAVPPHDQSCRAHALVADDLSLYYVQNDVEIKHWPTTGSPENVRSQHHSCRGCRRHMPCSAGAFAGGIFAATSMTNLSLRSQHAAEAGFAGGYRFLIGQHRTMRAGGSSANRGFVAICTIR